MTAVGEDGNARDSGIWFTDLGPGHVRAKLDGDGHLKYKLGKVRWEFQPDASNPDAMQMVWRKSGKKHTLDIKRIGAEEAACRSRVTPLPVPDVK